MVSNFGQAIKVSSKIFLANKLCYLLFTIAYLLDNVSEVKGLRGDIFSCFLNY